MKIGELRRIVNGGFVEISALTTQNESTVDTSEPPPVLNLEEQIGGTEEIKEDQTPVGSKDELELSEDDGSPKETK